MTAMAVICIKKCVIFTDDDPSYTRDPRLDGLLLSSSRDLMNHQWSFLDPSTSTC